MQPAPPACRTGSNSGSAPARTPKPGKPVAMACMFSILPSLSLMPTTVSGKASRSRAMREWLIGMPVSMGMW